MGWGWETVGLGTVGTSAVGSYLVEVKAAEQKVDSCCPGVQARDLGTWARQPGSHLQGLRPWWTPDLQVASKGYILGLGLMVAPLWPDQTGFVGQDYVGLMLATSDGCDPAIGPDLCVAQSLTVRSLPIFSSWAAGSSTTPPPEC